MLLGNYKMYDVYEVVREFEKELSEYTGAPYVVSVDSSTNALFLSCYRKEVDIDVTTAGV